MTETDRIPTVSLIGITGVGKTAVLRTLLADSALGEVNAGTGTTESVNSCLVKVDSRVLFTLADTPGFQKVIGLRGLLKEIDPDLEPARMRIDEIEALVPAGDHPRAAEFLHDSRSWKQTLKSDFLVWVLDVSEDPDRPRYPSQLDLLPFAAAASKSKPLVAALNKVCPGLYRERWEKILAENGFTRVLQLDAHRRSFADEALFWDTLAESAESVLSKEPFQTFRFERVTAEEEKRSKSCRAAARFLSDLAGLREKLGNATPETKRVELEILEKTFRGKIRDRENRFYADLAKIWGFPEESVSDGGRPFDSAAVSEKNPESGRVAVGAALGLLIDLAACGGTLGGGAVLGASLGAAAGKVYDYSMKRFRHAPKRRVYLVPDPRLLDAALDCAVYLLKEFSLRGHAVSAADAIELTKAEPVKAPELEEMIKKRLYGGWGVGLAAMPGVLWNKTCSLFSDNAVPERTVREIETELKRVVKWIE